MEILRLAVESRKVQLVDIALDLIQKLVAHKHIQGPVFSISHRREVGGKGGARRRITDDDEDLESVGADSSLPQVGAISKGFGHRWKAQNSEGPFEFSNLEQCHYCEKSSLWSRVSGHSLGIEPGKSPYHLCNTIVHLKFCLYTTRLPYT